MKSSMKGKATWRSRYKNYTTSDSNGTANKAVEVLGVMCNTKIVLRKPSDGQEEKETNNLVAGKKRCTWGTMRLV